MASKAKVKTVIHAVKYANGAVVAETDYDRNLLKSLPIGSAVKIMPLSNNRNYQHHKKFFALLDTGFEYWQPEFKVITESEEWAVFGSLEDLAKAAGIDFETIKIYGERRIDMLKTNREKS